MSETIAQPLREQITVPTSEQTNMQIAFAAVLAARRETFLARYPRILKLGVTGLIILLFCVPFFFSPPEPPSRDDGFDDLQSLFFQPEPPVIASAPARPMPLPSTGIVELNTDAEKKAAEANDATAGMVSLSVAPEPELVEETPQGPLPKISTDGRKPWQVYARPFDFQDPRPRVAIVMGDLGYSRVATDAALRRLPPNVTMTFDVQGTVIKEWLDRARQDGHETLLALPMEPFDYPRSDPGPNSLLTTLPNSDNIQRLLSALRQGVGYVGVTTLSGSRFSSDTTKIAPVLDVLRQRGLLVLDARVATHSSLETIARETNVPVAVNSRVIDANPTPPSIDQALSELEQTARVEGVAVGIASPLPVSLERIELWSKELSKRGIVLAPISAVVK